MAITEFDVIRMLDKMRVEKNITIINFTNGIISRRTYSRLISGEAKIGLTELLRFVDRLGVPLLEFLTLAHNTVFLENIHEYEFQQLIYDHRFKEAYDKYYNKVKTATLRTPFSAGFPLSIPILEEKVGIITRNELIQILHEKVDLNALLSNNLLTDDTIEVLIYFSPFATKKQITLIADYLYDVLINAKGIIIGSNLEQCTMKTYTLLLNLLPETTTDKKRVFECVIKALNFVSKAAVIPYDIDLLYEVKRIHDVYKFSDFVILHLMSALKCVDSPRFNKHKKELFIEKNVTLFINQLSIDFNGNHRKPLIQEIIEDAEKVLRSA